MKKAIVRLSTEAFETEGGDLHLPLLIITSSGEALREFARLLNRWAEKLDSNLKDGAPLDPSLHFHYSTHDPPFDDAMSDRIEIRIESLDELSEIQESRPALTLEDLVSRFRCRIGPH